MRCTMSLLHTSVAVRWRNNTWAKPMTAFIGAEFVGRGTGILAALLLLVAGSVARFVALLALIHGFVEPKFRFGSLSVLALLKL